MDHRHEKVKAFCWFWTKLSSISLPSIIVESKLGVSCKQWIECAPNLGIQRELCANTVLSNRLHFIFCIRWTRSQSLFRCSRVQLLGDLKIIVKTPLGLCTHFPSTSTLWLWASGCKMWSGLKWTWACTGVCKPSLEAKLICHIGNGIAGKTW